MLLLPGGEPALESLSLNTWVDLRGDHNDAMALELLVLAVQGKAPGPELAARVRETLATVCPYRGLSVFREEDAPFFFGRAEFTRRLADTASRESLVAVVGASGSGKSSVVRAGLLPRLRRGEGGVAWEMVTLLPGDRPPHALAAALVPLSEPGMSKADRGVEVTKVARHLLDGTGSRAAWSRMCWTSSRARTGCCWSWTSGKSSTRPRNRSSPGASSMSSWMLRRPCRSRRAHLGLRRARLSPLARDPGARLPLSLRACGQCPGWGHGPSDARTNI